jgi:hypothetical protein
MHKSENMHLGQLYSTKTAKIGLNYPLPCLVLIPIPIPIPITIPIPNPIPIPILIVLYPEEGVCADPVDKGAILGKGGGEAPSSDKERQLATCIVGEKT